MNASNIYSISVDKMRAKDMKESRLKLRETPKALSMIEEEDLEEDSDTDCSRALSEAEYGQSIANIHLWMAKNVPREKKTRHELPTSS